VTQSYGTMSKVVLQPMCTAGVACRPQKGPCSHHHEMRCTCHAHTSSSSSHQLLATPDEVATPPDEGGYTTARGVEAPRPYTHQLTCH
jgi:hypothetical protein